MWNTWNTQEFVKLMYSKGKEFSELYYLFKKDGLTLYYYKTSCTKSSDNVQIWHCSLWNKKKKKKTYLWLQMPTSNSQKEQGSLKRNKEYKIFIWNLLKYNSWDNKGFGRIWKGIFPTSLMSLWSWVQIDQIAIQRGKQVSPKETLTEWRPVLNFHPGTSKK